MIDGELHRSMERVRAEQQLIRDSLGTQKKVDIFAPARIPSDV